MGAETVLVSGPVHLPIPPGAQMMPVETAVEMLKTVEAELPADIAIFTAAVADWRVARRRGSEDQEGSGRPARSQARRESRHPQDRRSGQEQSGRSSSWALPPRRENVIENAKTKLAKKGCDLIIANDVSTDKRCHGRRAQPVHLVSASGVESWPELDKREVARRLMERLCRAACGAKA